MEMIIKKTIGRNNYTFVVQGKNLFDLVLESEKFSFGDMPKCGLCQSDALVLSAYETKDEGYKYVKVKCLHCKGDLTFGQPKKSPDTFYYRRTEEGAFDWKAFTPKEETK